MLHSTSGFLAGGQGGKVQSPSLWHHPVW